MNPLLSVRNPFFVSSFVTTQLNKAGVAVNPREAAKLIRAPEREPLLIPAPLPMRSLSGAGIGAGAGNRYRSGSGARSESGGDKKEIPR